ncbi:hypothetical protein QZH41_012562 [Actinostola sp. cb2023]|nr:hypothetical protein QZH41_012562 [Actinostola sp. cb2023]
MAATGPYILQKSTQLCFAVRSNINFDQIHPSVLSSKLAGKFNFPDGANSLPPRINLKVLSTAMNVFCEKVRLERVKFVIGKQQGKHMRRRRHHRHNELKPRPRENMNNVEERQKYEPKKSSDAVLLGAGGFFWTRERITDQDLINCTKNLKIADDEETEMQSEKENVAAKWEILSKQDHMSVLRRQMETGIYEYKVLGTFSDISARSFFTIQVDTEYRKVWDKYAAKLDIIDRDPESECEVLHWIMKYPYPLRTRDYVMMRRSKVDEREKKIVLISKAELGRETIWLKVGHMDRAQQGIPDYIQTLHTAARKIQTPDALFYCEREQSLTALVKR